MFVNEEKFWDGFRVWYKTHGGRHLTQNVVDNVNYLLNVWDKEYATKGYDWRFFVSVMTQIGHETGWTFAPIFERGPRSYFNKYDPQYNPEKARVLGNTQYGDGYRYRGAGHIQNTGRRNARVASQKLKEEFGLVVDLEASPEKRLDPLVSAHSAFLGCIQGWWTGRKLSHYITDEKTDYYNARRVVNGVDKARAIASMSRELHRIVRDSLVPINVVIDQKVEETIEERKIEKIQTRRDDKLPELRKQSRIAKNAYWIKILAAFKIFAGSLIAAVTSIDLVSIATSGSETARTYSGFLELLGLPKFWIDAGVVAIVVLALVQRVLAASIEKYRLEMHKDGETD